LTSFLAVPLDDVYSELLSYMTPKNECK
jgi:hypothetical protein